MYQDDINQSEPLSSGDTALNKICEGDASFRIICHTGTNKCRETLLKMTILKNKERTTVCNQERRRNCFYFVFEMSLSPCALGTFFSFCASESEIFIISLCCEKCLWIQKMVVLDFFEMEM